MLLQGWSFSCGVLLSRSSSHSTYYCGNFISYPPKTTFSSSSSSSSSSKAATTVQVVCASVGINEFAEIVHNKVLIAAAASAAIGQLSKPFTSTFLYGNRNNNNFDFVKAAFQAGGFPSSHSSAAVATAMSLGIERGFSDAIFGLAVVYASLVMYDAQGVRREVGIHAKALNRVLVQNFIPSEDVDDTIDSRPRISFSKRENFEPISLEEADSFSSKHRNAKILLGSENRKGQIGKLSSSSPSSDAEGET